MTLTELYQELAQLDEITLLEIMDLHADEIVSKFRAEIEERFDELSWKISGPSAPVLREEETEELTGYLKWIPDEEAPNFDDEDGRGQERD